MRIATFNIAMGLKQSGEMSEALSDGKDDRLQKVAAIIQRVRPDIILLSEFDHDPDIDAADLFNRHYLANSQDGQEPIQYPYDFRSAVNTGVDSGLDLDRDGATGGPADAWGFGAFPGQYGMLVLSRYPLEANAARTFRHFRWADIPGALRPMDPESGRPFHPDEVWQQLRLSSKNHWDLPFVIDGRELHLLAHHPTPPVFDGPEDRNGRRNHDEIRFWRDYTGPAAAPWITDDAGGIGGLPRGARFVIAGDFNADPLDGDSTNRAAVLLLEAPWIDASCKPASRGGAEAARNQGGKNAEHRGDPALDTADFNDRFTGNLRIDYVLPSANLKVTGCGVHWPARDEPGHERVNVSDHRLVWLDIQL